MEVCARPCVCVCAHGDQTHHQIKSYKVDETFADTSGLTGSSEDEGSCYWLNELILVHVDTHIPKMARGENINVCACACVCA